MKATQAQLIGNKKIELIQLQIDKLKLMVVYRQLAGIVHHFSPCSFASLPFGNFAKYMNLTIIIHD